MALQGSRCPNFNHSRTNAPVRYCPICGEVVNDRIPDKMCVQTEHAKSRRDRNKFCVHCGEQVIQAI